MVTATYYQESLKSELQKRCSRNSRYSLRAFSKAMNIDAPAMSRILSGKLIPSAKLAKKILDRVDFSPDEKELFLSSLVAAHGSKRSKKFGSFLGASHARPTTVQELNRKLFTVIADWYNYAVLELTFTKDFQA